MSRQLGVGRVLATSCIVWLGNLPRLIAIAALLYLPLLAWDLARWIDALAPMYEIYDDLFGARQVLSAIPRGTFVIHAATTAALTHAVFVALTGRPAPIGRALGTAAQRFFPVVGVTLLVELLGAGVFVAVFWGAMISLGLGLAWLLLMSYLIMAGRVALLSLFYVAVPTATAERRGVLGSIARSFRLARGARIRVLALALVGGLIVVGSYQLLRIAVIDDPRDAAAQELFSYLVIVIHVVVQPLAVVIAAVTYRALRENQEGATADELGRIFE